MDTLAEFRKQDDCITFHKNRTLDPISIHSKHDSYLLWLGECCYLTSCHIQLEVVFQFDAARVLRHPNRLRIVFQPSQKSSEEDRFSRSKENLHQFVDVSPCFGRKMADMY